MRDRAARGVAGLALGALPGAALLLVAQFLVHGERQLEVGVAGLWLAILGAVIGLTAGVLRRRRRPTAH
jgi:VIT1/CCC1 family predicted Fe2+/Mn2+ transporter